MRAFGILHFRKCCRVYNINIKSFSQSVSQNFLNNLTHLSRSFAKTNQEDALKIFEIKWLVLDFQDIIFERKIILKNLLRNNCGKCSFNEFQNNFAVLIARERIVILNKSHGQYTQFSRLAIGFP